ncbi:MAG: bifunctional alpha,alpha-trehalose-phosphate synthase (UDP-forming)/trehalose-phosphatase [Chitinophagaceae bacterium]
MSRLIIISNRLPFSIEKKEDTLSLRQSSGGLVSALNSYFEQTKKDPGRFTSKMWLGSADFTPHEWKQVIPSASENNYLIEPIFIESELYSAFYNGFANSTLWPLFHYFPSLVEYKKEYFAAYEQVNALFAEKILSILKEDDTIWIHDYQLMLLPEMIRKLKSKATVGFFLHIPFPSYEIFRLMPTKWKKCLLQGVLGADLVGFHTHDYSQHFIQSAKMLLGIDHQFNKLQFNNHLVKVDLFPIGIDFEKFTNAAKNPEILALRDKIKNTYPDKKIIFSVDRMDYSKGLMYRLNGFEEFLDTFPEWKEKVVFILNVIPSRDEIPAYIERKKQMEEKIGGINGKLSTLEWQPVIYRYGHSTFDELSALYQAADAALITPLRDGMNLVAKEYVASCAAHTGVLILSEFTGAASELNEAVLVNPTDSNEVANSIQYAMTMSPVEQKQRMALMQKRLKDYDVVRWVNDFLEQLNEVKEEQSNLSVKLMDITVMEKIIADYHKASKRTILLDYDGTLAPFTRLPAQAKPQEELLHVLEQLTNDEKNDVVIISGRDADTLDSWLGTIPLHLVAEHGAFIKRKGTDWEQQSTILPAWKDQIRPILQLFVTRCAGSFIEEKRNTMVWHYRNTHPDLGFIRSRELMNSLLQLTANSPLQVIDGNKVLEVRLTGFDKGITALKLIKAAEPDFILCMGDDTTDEDMFKVLNDNAYTIKIGLGATAAHYNIRSQQSVLPLLSKLLTPHKITT